MKKTIVAIFAMASAAVFAGANDLLITFSTKGPDCYADGKQVLPGECYALIWTGADGAQKTVLTYPGATDKGNCPPVLFIVDEKDVPKYANGTWGVYLLDTRDYAADPTGMTLAGRTAGNPDVINVKAAVAEGIANTSTMESVMSAGAIVSTSFDIPKPVVSAIKVEGAYVYITVKDIVPCFEYTVKAGSDTKSFAIPEGVEKDASSTVKEITLTVPKQDGAQFFKVTTK